MPQTAPAFTAQPAAPVGGATAAAHEALPPDAAAAADAAPAAPEPLPCPPPLKVAPSSLAGWVQAFDIQLLPVAQATVDALAEMRAIEDDVDAHLLAQTVGADPLMTLKLFAHIGTVRRPGALSEPETVTAALVLLGIAPFFRAFDRLRSVEADLAACPEALAGYSAVLRRAHRAANFTQGFALQRLDHDVATLHGAAMLHDFAELLLWWRAPMLALAIQRAQEANPQLRSAQAQQARLNCSLAELEHALAEHWRLPEALVQATDARRGGDSPQARTVGLAVRLARHTAHGWDNPAVPDDVREIADLLHLGIDPTRELLASLD